MTTYCHIISLHFCSVKRGYSSTIPRPALPPIQATIFGHVFSVFVSYVVLSIHDHCTIHCCVQCNGVDNDVVSSIGVNKYVLLWQIQMLPLYIHRRFLCIRGWASSCEVNDRTLLSIKWCYYDRWFRREHA